MTAAAQAVEPLGADRTAQSLAFLAKDCIGLGVDLDLVGCRQVTGLVLLRGPGLGVRGMRLVLDRILVTGERERRLGKCIPTARCQFRHKSSICGTVFRNDRGSRRST